MVAAKRPLYELQLPDAKWFQDKLSGHGYNTSHSGEWDDLTRDSLISFQMKYRPAKYDGRPDAEIAALLDVANTPQGMVLSNEFVNSKPYTSRW
jgi:N-acetylmuramoyl-L-alanine amidase